MASRPATTVLLLTRSAIVRADFGRGAQPKSLGLWTQPRPEVSDLPTLVEVALGLGPAPGKNVWILTTDVWTQALVLTGGQGLNNRLGDEELAAALNFEAESLSGQSAFESVAAFRRLPRGAGYWVTQVRSADLAQIDEAVCRVGGRLAGIGHPAGLPRALASAGRADAPWERVELWPDAVIGLHGDGQGNLHVHVQNTDPSIGRWQNEWNAWRESRGSALRHEILAGPGVVAPLDSAATVIRLDDEAALLSWSTAWVHEARATPAAPMVRPQRRPMSSGQRTLAALALGVLVALGCIGHFQWMDRGVMEMQEKTKQALAPGTKLEEYRKEAKTLEAKIAELKTEQGKLEYGLRALTLQRQRLADFLTQLSAQQTEDLVVEKIDLNVGEPSLHGLCLRPDQADQFATGLGQALSDSGWEVHAATKKARGVAADGGPWTFEIHFRRAGASAAESPGMAQFPGKRDRSK